MDSLCWTHGGTQGVDGECLECIAARWRKGQWCYIRYSDGSYSAIPCKDEAEALKWKANGFAIKYFPPAEWHAWQAHCDAEAVWQAMFRDLDNAACDAGHK